MGGHAALDFANTLDNRFDPPNLDELLLTYDDFVHFCEQAGVILAAEARALLRIDRREKAAALAEVKELREVLERLFSAKARNEAVEPGDLRALEERVQKALLELHLTERDGVFRWEWAFPEGEATAPLCRIAFAAAELLISDRIHSVRECQAETCRWLFVDISKNHSRRWCDMKVCGNRHKARRYYDAHSDHG